MVAQGPVVVHSTQSWLPGTQTWLYNQVRLTGQTLSHVACHETQNLEQFGVSNLHVRDAFWDRSGILDRMWSRPLVGYPLRCWSRWSHRRFLRGVIDRTGAAIVHSHFGINGWNDLAAVGDTGVRHLVSVYGFDVSYLPRQHSVWKKRYRDLFAAADGVLCEGPHMAESVMQLECPAKKVHVHHLGVEVEHIDFRARTLADGEPVRVLMAASFHEKKGLPYALRAVARLVPEFDIQVTLIGDAVAGSSRGTAEKDRILATIDEHRLSERVDLRGFCTHETLFSEAYRHHIFVSPSVTAASGDTEGGAPVALIEMAATGMPVVSTTHCDIPEIIQHGQGGLLADERDVEGLATHLRWLIEHPARWAAMGRSARAHIEREFDAQRQARSLEELYRSLLGEGS